MHDRAHSEGTSCFATSCSCQGWRTPYPLRRHRKKSTPLLFNLEPSSFGYPSSRWIVNQGENCCPDTAKRGLEPPTEVLSDPLWREKEREKEREILVGARSPRLPRLYKLPVRRGNLTCTPAAVRKGYDPRGRISNPLESRNRPILWFFLTEKRRERKRRRSHEVWIVLVVLLVDGCHLHRQNLRKSLHRWWWVILSLLL